MTPVTLPALPTFAGLALQQIELTDQQITLHASTTTPSICCPDCSAPAQRVHSTYTRTLVDLPWSGLCVQLRLRVRRFFCRTPACPRKTFVEQVPGLTRAYAQRTTRVNEVLQALGMALGGEAGQRLSHRLAIPTSADTLLRRIRQAPLPPASPPRVVGVDEWAKRKGQHYGTILVDLEQHRPVDLLPDRTPEDFAAWLRAHPGVEVITRDRASYYADGATQGAPAAVQVADRWHLTANLGDALQRMLERQTSALRAAARYLQPAAEPPGVQQPPAIAPEPLAFPQGHIVGSAEVREHQWREAKALHQQGWSCHRIAQHLQLNRRTVTKYVFAETLPRRTLPQTTSSVTPYHAYLIERWTAGCQQGTQLWTELCAQGYRGSLSSVYRALKHLRPEDGRRTGGPALPPAPRPLSPRQAMWLLVRRPERLKPDEAAYRAALCEVCADVAIAYPLAQRFMALVRERQAAALDAWLAAAEASRVREVVQFAKGLRRDYAAVKAALTLSWSQGQVEGQVNRLKLIKRMMYGRGSVDLLRQRVLYAA